MAAVIACRCRGSGPDSDSGKPRRGGGEKPADTHKDSGGFSAGDSIVGLMLLPSCLLTAVAHLTIQMRTEEKPLGTDYPRWPVVSIPLLLLLLFSHLFFFLVKSSPRSMMGDVYVKCVSSALACPHEGLRKDARHCQ